MNETLHMAGIVLVLSVDCLLPKDHELASWMEVQQLQSLDDRNSVGPNIRRVLFAEGLQTL